MGSVIDGFDNDIFISYRQNDNKVSGAGEGWVTEFVNHLSDELEATVKGKVTIYFDKNPHDGLLETHSVSESLDLRLKSLIFIPIISQTYCDHKSFAWQNEFLPFNRKAAVDKFGLSIKLLSGNIASRVLPIRIHEIEAEDLKMLESELKGKLRPIDFIFKSPGVNRPLRSKEEDPLKNATHTLYRNQINKTANAIKDLINGFRNFTNTPEKFKAKTDQPFVAVSGKSSANAKTIAVLPFACEKSEDEFLGEGLAEELMTMLGLIKGLKIVPRTPIIQSDKLNVNLKDIAERFGAGKVITGSILHKNGQLEISVKGNSTDDGSIFWSDHFERNVNGVSGLTGMMAIALLEKLGIQIRDNERDLILKPIAGNADAYLSYLRGRFYGYRSGDDLVKSLTHFQKAVELDRDFSQALAGMAKVNLLLGYHSLLPIVEALNKAKMAAVKALQVEPSLSEAWTSLAFVNMAYEWHWPEAEHDFRKVFAVNATHPSAKEKYNRYLAQITANLEAVEKEPITTIPHFLQAYAFLHRGKFDEALKAAHHAVSHDSNSFMAHRALGLSYLGLENHEEAIKSLQKAASLSNRHYWILFELMGAYMLAGKIEEAQTIMDEALSESNTIPFMVHNFFFPGQ